MHRARAPLRALLARRRSAAALAAVAVIAGLAAPALAHRAAGAASAASAAHGIALGFLDYEITELPKPRDVSLELERARAAGATVWGLQILWSKVSPTRPPTLADARDPNWRGYDWTATDAAVRAITAAHLQTLAVINGAPAWAEGPDRPSLKAAPAGTWDPSAQWLGAFATALATRYSGSFPDAAGVALPAIRDWEPWNEPNLAVFLTPQWKRTADGYQAVSPTIYRGLQNAFYAGVKAVAPQDVVAAGTTAPFGDPPGGRRIQPVTFWEDLLCLSAGANPTPTHCGAHVSFDAVSHHAYPIGPPTYHAIDADDVSVPDLGKITRLIPIAERAGTVLPDTPKPLWITEISWESPPDPHGLSYSDQAHYLEGAIYVLYHEGASMFVWFNLRDQPLNPPSYTNLQSGVYSRGRTVAEDTPKPSLTAYEFPFTAYRDDGYADLWGLAPTPGPVAIQAFVGYRWVTVLTLQAAASRIFNASVLVGPRTSLRAVAGKRTSLVWTTS